MMTRTAQAGLSTTLGLDRHCFDRAVQAKKTVVGLETAHLVGPDGLLALLAHEGYTIERQ